MKICNIVTTLHACAVITAKQKSALAGAFVRIAYSSGKGTRAV